MSQGRTHALHVFAGNVHEYIDSDVLCAFGAAADLFDHFLLRLNCVHVSVCGGRRDRVAGLLQV